MSSDIPQARKLIEEVLLIHVTDDEAKKLLRRALRLMKRPPRDRQPHVIPRRTPGDRK